MLLPLAALEGTVRLLGWQTAYDPHLNFGRVHSFFEDVKIEGETFKKVKARQLYREREVVFSAKKDPGVFRIFCVGGSASAGWPHPGEEIYSAYLLDALAAAYPGRTIEVHNVSAQAYASYRVRLILEEIAAFEPDLVIIYSGNNEFLEPRRYQTEPHWSDGIASVVAHSRVYTLVRGSPLIAKWFPGNTLQTHAVSGVAFEQWSKIEKIPVLLRIDHGQFDEVAKHYQHSIASMLETLDDMEVPALLMTVPSNLRDWKPNVSIPTERTSHAGWVHYNSGQAALAEGSYDAALEHLTKAVSASPEHAASHFYLGHALEAVGRHTEAYDSFVRARDQDANPFRALSRFNHSLRRLSADFAKVRLVDLEQAFRDAAAPRAPGFELMLDYVHPTKKGNLLIAQQVFQSIADGGYLGVPVKPFAHVPERDDNGTIYDEENDHDLQAVLLYIAMMMHQYEMVVRVSDKLIETPAAIDTMDPEDAYHTREAREIFGELIELDKKELEAGTTLPERADLEQRLNQLYKSVFGNYVEYQGKRWQ